jgi:hypothetical protein
MCTIVLDVNKTREIKLKKHKNTNLQNNKEKYVKKELELMGYSKNYIKFLFKLYKI